MIGFLNGDRLYQRLVQCDDGFFVQAQFISTPFLLSELYQGAPLLANTLHTVEVHPEAGRARWSIVFIAGGYTLIVSRRYEAKKRATSTVRCSWQTWQSCGDTGSDLDVYPSIALSIPP